MWIDEQLQLANRLDGQEQGATEASKGLPGLLCQKGKRPAAKTAGKGPEIDYRQAVIGRL